MTKTSTGTTRETAVSFWYKGEIEREREREIEIDKEKNHLPAHVDSKNKDTGI